ncbi:hypothetical protein F2Q69_00055100 [Brassica cretica]|uniref:Uncharacterized protein n=1 Tax=Brassica cretica TaxID=69181 RepID=A0A8S9N8J0_BRACR|nr:hypothetical protein F2Q69_00055100 [Brassica cretica]
MERDDFGTLGGYVREDSDRVSAFCTGYGIEPSVDGSVITGPKLVLDGGMVLVTGYGAVEPIELVGLSWTDSYKAAGLVIRDHIWRLPRAVTEWLSDHLTDWDGLWVWELLRELRRNRQSSSPREKPSRTVTDWKGRAGRNERKRAEREENRSERGRDGQKADRSLRYGRGSVCYATPPDLNVDQIILMMPEGDKGKTDRRDTEFCGEGLVGDGSRCAYYGIRRVQTVGPCATHGKETVGLVCTDGTRRFWNARRLRSRGVCTDDADQTARVIWAVNGCIVLERDTGGALSMASVLSILDGWLETKPSLIVYLDHVGMVG